MSNGVKETGKVARSGVARVIAAHAAGTAAHTCADANLTDRLNGVCTTLAACEELCDAITNRVTGGGPPTGAGMPQDGSLSGLAHVAQMRADTLLANLRALAGQIGT